MDTPPIFSREEQESILKMKTTSLFQLNDSNIKLCIKIYLKGGPQYNLPVTLRGAIISKWNVSEVTNMSGLFANTDFNENISDWDVSKVKDMSYMFKNCKKFNKPLDWSYKLTKVTTMEGMFSECVEFNQPLTGWNVSKVSSMNDMFRGCTNFNQPLDNWIGVDNVINVEYMFYGCTNFNQPLSSWFQKPPKNIERKILPRKMEGMFYKCTNFKQDLSTWNIQDDDSTEYIFADTNMLCCLKGEGELKEKKYSWMKKDYTYYCAREETYNDDFHPEGGKQTKTRKLKTRKLKTRKLKTRKLKTRKLKTRKLKTRKLKTRKTN